MYKYLVFGHLFCVIVGIGNTAMNPLYGAFAKNRQGPGGLAVSEANFKAAHIGEYFIYAIPVFGILMVINDKGFADFDQTWIWLSLLLYVIAVGIVHGALFPRIRRMITLQEELVAMGPPPEGAPAGGPPPQVAELEELGSQVGAAGGSLHVIATVLVILMVWKPGL
jgi:uncharacterized membrane protein